MGSRRTSSGRRLSIRNTMRPAPDRGTSSECALEECRRSAGWPFRARATRVACVRSPPVQPSPRPHAQQSRCAAGGDSPTPIPRRGPARRRTAGAAGHDGASRQEQVMPATAYRPCLSGQDTLIVRGRQRGRHGSSLARHCLRRLTGPFDIRRPREQRLDTAPHTKQVCRTLPTKERCAVVRSAASRPPLDHLARGSLPGPAIRSPTSPPPTAAASPAISSATRILFLACSLRLLPTPAPRREYRDERRRGRCRSDGPIREQGIALLFEHAADDRTDPPRAPAHHFFREDVDLPPALLLQEADR